MNTTNLQLNQSNVKSIFANCRSYPTISSDPYRVQVKGVTQDFLFDSRLLQCEKQHISELLEQLPLSLNTGDSLAALRQTRDGKCWADNDTLSPEVLMALGIAIGKLQKTVWHGRTLLKRV